ncbi:MAG: Asp-tRNA(Asn)/Glu-tRNA(Gln) amidotransferase subunit GatC [Flavonifractor plautii]
MERILDYMAVLDGLDTAGAEPLSHVFPLKNVLRPDETAPSAGRTALLAGAPAADGESFLVPKAVE